ncbi:SMP-30/gluconolactonase/LRE family protein [Spirosoma sp. KCTC 42546]|uniref:SMP-30/gluconolactonase/LRE family protein n=1 Tax=Spirosoma sp. KCTC 42546 TaxID=2520506 RepID=UPI001158C5C9|nr:SMP-30/gluconolactonase/LRE family protein [Spirosoma sp. KCTC 42546]QDK77128.1 SMP-30/gluconolactonase/LRE family protein [Spirosoma sp. KCTC 42546]
MDTIRVLAEGLRFPEGPAFDTNGNLWCVEQEGEGLFCRYSNGKTKRIQTGGRPNALACNMGFMWFCDSGQNAIRRLNLKTEAIETVISHVSGQPLNMPNDLTFDDRNNLLITCPGPPDAGQQGYVVVYSANGSVEIIADGLLYPNGLAFYPDKQTLLIAETHQQRIWSGYWDSEGLSWETIRVWATVIDAPVGASIPGPDGITPGPDGNLYVAVFGAGIIRVFSADGAFVRDIKLPGQNPSNCIYDLSGKLGLIVTETEKGQLLSIV